jgi:hypothetical protein
VFAPEIVLLGVGSPEEASWFGVNSTRELLLKFGTHKSPEASNARL